MKKLIFSILISSLLVSCKTTSVYVDVLKPAQITVNPGIKSIVFVNRSRPAKAERARNMLEGAITGEAPFADRIGSEKCLEGAVARLNGSPRFTAALATDVELKGTGTRQFPEPLDWDLIEGICKKYNSDALVALEVFDSNNHYDVKEREAKKKENDKEITYTEFRATLDVEVQAGWRIYYVKQHKIVDQNIFTDWKGWSSTSDAKKKAQQGLPSQDRAVSDAGYYAGQQYAFRISPLWIRVSRMYYKKGNADFDKAFRKAQTNDWQGAADLWQKYANSSDQKIASYATYNLALASEMNGDLQGALEWARKSYVDYQNKKARYYMNILEQRINDQQRLDEQMKESE